MSQYGSTKRKGETSLLGLAPESIIIRTGWLYSASGHNFVRTILAKAAADKSLRVVTDQIGTPTYAADLAAAILEILFSPQWVPGIVNFSNEGVASWYDFAVAIVAEAGLEGVEITPVLTGEYPTQAIRPYYSVLDKSRYKATYGVSIPHWREALKRCIKQLNSNAEQCQN